MKEAGMYHDYRFEDVLATSSRVAWQIGDVIGYRATLDFTRPFLPDSLARTAGLEMLTPRERIVLNQIRGHEYLSLFGLVEEFILPFVLDHARPQLTGDDWRVRALLQFASEEAKHIHLFKRFQQAFTQGFGTACKVIGPAEAIAAEILRHDPLAVALLILHIEWMTQRHYVDSVQEDGELDPLFKSLLRHHWIEEAQHAKLDTLMVESLAEGRGVAAIDRAVDEYLEMNGFLAAGLANQVQFNLDAFERATGRTLSADERANMVPAQQQALRWTYIGSGMSHARVAATLRGISPAAADRIAAIAPSFC
jgi:hypothetical protein